MNGIDAFEIRLFLKLRSQALGNAVHTAHGGHNPHFVADSHFPILTAIALESAVIGGDIQLFIYRMVFIGERTRQIGLQVILVHPLSGLQVLACMSDGIAILDDISALRCIGDEHLMASRRVL